MASESSGQRSNLFRPGHRHNCPSCRRTPRCFDDVCERPYNDFCKHCRPPGKAAYYGPDTPLEWRYRLPKWVRDHWPDRTDVRLNLACGEDYRPGWVNSDKYAPDVDERVDLFEFPWPWPADTFDFILASHFIEHVPPVLESTDGERHDGISLLLKEAARVLKPGGRFLCRTPAGVEGVGNVTHYRYFTLDSFNYLENGSARSATRNQVGPALTLVDKGAGERSIRLGRLFSTAYHVPKYLGFRPTWIGKAREIIFVFEPNKEATRDA